jgi:3-methyladenine DNA glycosylase Mpg
VLQGEGDNMGGNSQKLDKDFFRRPVDEVARELVGKIIVKEKDGKEIVRLRIITTEAYGGGENSSMPDSDSHSHESSEGPNNGKGQELVGGNLYIAYSRSPKGGSQRQVNITTGRENDAQAVLIKECQLLYKDSIPNREGDKKGMLTETTIADKLGLSEIDVGGHSMEACGISVLSDGDLIETTERKNVKDNKLWRFSIGRLLSLLLVPALIISLGSCGAPSASSGVASADYIYEIMDEPENYIGERIEYVGELDGIYAPIISAEWYAVDFNDPRLGSSDPHIMCIVTESTDVVNEMRTGTNVAVVGTVVATPTLDGSSNINDLTSWQEFQGRYGYGFCIELTSIERV